MKRKITSEIENRERSNPYAPFKSYTEYRDQIIIIAMDINDIIGSIPPTLVHIVWLHDARFRHHFRQAVKMAHYIHREDLLQRLLPWCQFDLTQYAQRFDAQPAMF
jgi:hypothetical protein